MSEQLIDRLALEAVAILEKTLASSNIPHDERRAAAAELSDKVEQLIDACRDYYRAQGRPRS
jgi:hypothetical protein